MKWCFFFLAVFAACLMGLMAPGDCLAQGELDSNLFVSSPIDAGAALDLSMFVPTPQGWKNLKTGEIYRREIYGFPVTDPADIAAYDKEVLNRLTSMKIASFTKTTFRGDTLLVSRCAGGRLLHSLLGPAVKVKQRIRCHGNSCSTS